MRAQVAAYDGARTRYEAAVLTALQDVEDAFAALRGDRDRLAHLQQASAAAGGFLFSCWTNAHTRESW